MKRAKIIAAWLGAAFMLSACQQQESALTEGTSVQTEAPAPVSSETAEISETTASESSAETSELSALTEFTEDGGESDTKSAEAETTVTAVSVTEASEKEVTAKSETAAAAAAAAEPEKTETKKQPETEKTNTDKGSVFINIPKGYSKRLVEDRTDNPEIYELFSGAFFIDNCFYSGIGYDSSGIFENLGDVEGYYGFKHSGIKYSDYEALLRRYFTEEYAAELAGREICCKNIDGELCYDSDSHRGGDIYFESAYLTIAEQSGEKITLNVTAFYTGKYAEDYTYSDHTDVNTLTVVNTAEGWRLDGFCNIC